MSAGFCPVLRCQQLVPSPWGGRGLEWPQDTGPCLSCRCSCRLTLPDFGPHTTFGGRDSPGTGHSSSSEMSHGLPSLGQATAQSLDTRVTLGSDMPEGAPKPAKPMGRGASEWAWGRRTFRENPPSGDWASHRGPGRRLTCGSASKRQQLEETPFSSKTHRVKHHGIIETLLRGRRRQSIFFSSGTFCNDGFLHLSV